MCLLFAGFGTPAAAQAQTAFGANLARPANATYGCEAFPTTDAFGQRLFLATGAPTCTYLGNGTPFDQREVPGVPGTGVVTRVRVKAGPVTGPTQVTVLQATRSSVGVACCFHTGQSQVFRPTPNAVTTVGCACRSDLTSIRPSARRGTTWP